ncbi:hypothetical protein BVY01_00710 [bacterium I07]|nr:hypothetical protein BVY01_00710 [bacterium I07]
MKHQDDHYSQDSFLPTDSKHVIQTIKDENIASTIKITTNSDVPWQFSPSLMENVVERQNMLTAYYSLFDSLQGYPDIEAVIDSFKIDCWDHWKHSKQKLLLGEYMIAQTYPAEEVDTPQNCELDLEILYDRLMQRAITQVLVSIWVPNVASSQFPNAVKDGATIIKKIVDYIFLGNSVVNSVDLRDYIAQSNLQILRLGLESKLQGQKVLSLVWQYIERDFLSSTRDVETMMSSSIEPSVCKLFIDIFTRDLDLEMEKLSLSINRKDFFCLVFTKSEKDSKVAVELIGDMCEKVIYNQVIRGMIILFNKSSIQSVR